MKKLIRVFVSITIIYMNLFAVVPAVGAVSVAENEYEYYVDSENCAVLTKYLGAETEVTLPAEIDGHKVIATNETFMKNTVIEKAVIADGIAIIGDRTFLQCSNLKEVIVPSSVKELGKYAFSGIGISTIVLPQKKNMVIGEGCFSNDAALDAVLVAAKSLEIGPSAFIPSGLTLFVSKKIFDLNADIFPENVGSTTLYGLKIYAKHRGLYNILHYYATAPLYIEALIAVAVWSVVYFVPFLFWMLIKWFRILCGKDIDMLYRRYNQNYTSAISFSSASSSLLYKPRKYPIKRIICLTLISLLLFLFANILLQLAVPAGNAFSKFVCWGGIFFAVFVLGIFIVIIWAKAQKHYDIKHFTEPLPPSSRIRKVKKG